MSFFLRTFSTLIKLICGKLTGSNKIDINSNARIALVSQHHIDMLKNLTEQYKSYSNLYL